MHVLQSERRTAGRPRLGWVGVLASAAVALGPVAATGVSSAATAAAAEPTVTQVSMGDTLALALRSDGSVVAWGQDSHGQLGNGRTASQSVPVLTQRGAIPSGVNIVQVAAGSEQALALGDDGKVYAWGGNTYGELGDGTTTDRTTPVAVAQGAIPAGVKIVKIAGQFQDSYALGDDGKVYAWGANAGHQLGNGTTTASTTPVAVAQGQVPDGVKLVDVSAASGREVALGDDGKAYLWGSSGATPIAGPAGVPAGVKLVQVSSGNDGSVRAVGDDGKVYGWGANTFGQLGNGTTAAATTVVAAAQGAVPAGVKFVSVGALNNATIALGDDGKAYTWGQNSNGQLGNPDVVGAQVLTPVAVSQGAIPDGVRLTAVSAEKSRSAAALGSDSNVYVWGFNDFGELGDGTTTYQGAPVLLTIPANVAATPTTTVLRLSREDPVAGQPFTLTATVNPADATGTVEFFDGTTSLGTGQVNGGVASLTRSDLAAGSGHSFTAVFTPADPGAFRSSTSPAITGDRPTVTGSPQVGTKLSVADLGPTLDGCLTVSYRWLRDGAAFAGTPRWAVDAKFMSDTNGPMMGDPGTETLTSGTSAFNPGSYVVSVPDLGHQLSVQATCVATGISRTSTPTPIVTASAPDQPVIQSLVGRSYYARVAGTVPQVDAEGTAGVVGDPTNPSVPIMVGELDADGQPVDPSGITVTVTSITGVGGTTTGVLDADAITITGTGAQRTISFNPLESGLANVELTVTGTTGLTTTFTFPYKAAAATTPTSRTLQGSSDASTAIDTGAGYFFVGDDEKSPIRLYNGAVSGREVAQFPTGDTNGGELDLEASARKGDMVYWFGSQGNDKDGKAAPSRQQVFQEKISGTGANATLTPVASYSGLLRDLVAWDNSNGARFGLANGINKTRPDAINGVDLEGAEFSPDGSELYLGMRSPLSPAAVGGKAVIFTITNFEQVFSGAATHFTFGDPILLNLGGQSIREIRKNADNQYLIISGVAGGDIGTNYLWVWDGQPGHAPQKLTTALPQDTVPFGGGVKGEPGDWEGIADMPDRITTGAQVRLIMDDGYDQPYGDGVENKDNGDDNSSIGRTDVFTLTGPTTTSATILPGVPPRLQVHVAAVLSGQPITGTARLTITDAAGQPVTTVDAPLLSAKLTDGAASINLQPINSFLTPGDYTVVASYVPGPGGGPASTSQPVTWTVPPESQDDQQ